MVEKRDGKKDGDQIIMKMSKEELRKIVNEEMRKNEKEYNRKLSMYIAKLNKYKRDISSQYLNESNNENQSRELLGELKVLEKITEDLEDILYNTKEEI